MLVTNCNTYCNLCSYFSGSYSDFLVDNDGNFKYFFFSFGASIAEWPFCRPIISIDDIFLKCKYRGIILLVASLDDDNHIFPLEFGIVNSENDAIRLWFFGNLKKAIENLEEFMIISNWNSSIPKAMRKIFSNAQHRISTQHLVMNLNSRFKYGAVEPIFKNCAKVYSLEEYDCYFILYRKNTQSMVKWTQQSC